MKGSYRDPAYAQQANNESLVNQGANFKTFTDGYARKNRTGACRGGSCGLVSGTNGVWVKIFGARSILSDPRSKIMQKIFNI